MSKHPVFEQAIDILKNGGDVPVETSLQLIGAMIKETYTEAACARKVAEKNRKDLKEMIESPSLLWLFKHQTGKTVASIGSFLGGLVLLWFFLHVLAHIPSVEAWIVAVIGLPVP